ELGQLGVLAEAAAGEVDRLQLAPHERLGLRQHARVAHAQDDGRPERLPANALGWPLRGSRLGFEQRHYEPPDTTAPEDSSELPLEPEDEDSEEDPDDSLAELSLLDDSSLEEPLEELPVELSLFELSLSVEASGVASGRERPSLLVVLV